MRRLLNKERQLAPERAINLVSQAAAALDAAHSKGLVHRDVKPGNILIEDRPEGEHAYLTDFGLTKHIEATSGVTATGAFVGTLDYVAPEQIKGGRTDARTDVYALGCVLFESLTGQPPFATHEEKVAKIFAHLQEEAPPLLARGRNLPDGLDAVVARALAKEPHDRFSAGDLARAAQAAIDYQPVQVPEHTVAVGAAAPRQRPATAASARRSRRRQLHPRPRPSRTPLIRWGSSRRSRRRASPRPQCPSPVRAATRVPRHAQRRLTGGTPAQEGARLRLPGTSAILPAPPQRSRSLPSPRGAEGRWPEQRTRRRRPRRPPEASRLGRCRSGSSWSPSTPAPTRCR